MKKSILNDYYHIVNDFSRLLKGETRTEILPASLALALPTLSRPAPPSPSTPARDPSGEDSTYVDSLERVDAEVRSCQKCPLCKTRTHAVPGLVNIEANPVLVVGEAPGYEEDRQGLPFVGPSGADLDRWLAAINLDRRRNLAILNVVKCRPPGNRNPEPEEIETCRPYLDRQIALIKPFAILALGRFAANCLSGRQSALKLLREDRLFHRDIPVIATYHPAAVMRNEDYKRLVWTDLKKLRALLEIADNFDKKTKNDNIV